MANVNEPIRPNKRSAIRTLLFVLAILSSPLACCGGITLLNALPASVFPPILDFFSSEAQIENRTSETLYLTPITTTYGSPQVIRQSGKLRQRDFPVAPGQSFVLEYDAADAPLSGMVVCRTDEDCRLLPVDYSNMYQLDSFENLPMLDPAWLLAVRSHRLYDFTIVVLPILGLLPVALFLSWYSLGKPKNKKAD